MELSASIRQNKSHAGFSLECLFHLKLGHILNLTRLVSCLHARKHQRRCGGHANLLWFVYMGRIISPDHPLFPAVLNWFVLCQPLNATLIDPEVLIF